jgi:hypothetical protein
MLPFGNCVVAVEQLAMTMGEPFVESVAVTQKGLPFAESGSASLATSPQCNNDLAHGPIS